MSRFYFHFVERNMVLRDQEGCECHDRIQAVTHAVRQIREMLAHEIRESGTICLARSISIGDENGGLENLNFADAVKIDPVIS